MKKKLIFHPFDSFNPCSLSHLLLVDGDALEGLLDDPTAVHLQRELLDVSSELKTRVKKGFMFHRSFS